MMSFISELSEPMSVSDSYTSPLHQFIEEWLTRQGTNWEWLISNSDLPKGTSTGIRKGSTPRPATLRKLSDAMGIPRRKLFELAGYVKPEELEPENFDIDDPDLSLFFRGEWTELSDDEKAFIRDLVKDGNDLLKRRREREEQG